MTLIIYTIKITFFSIISKFLKAKSLGKLYADLFCKFGYADIYNENDLGYNLNERSFDHNYMALYARMDMEDAVRQYEINNGISRATEHHNFKDIFTDTIWNMAIDKEMVYQALSWTWTGILRTREWRTQASLNADSLRLFQLYKLIIGYESFGIEYSQPPASRSVISDKKTFELVANPIPQLCQ